MTSSRLNISDADAVSYVLETVKRLGTNDFVEAVLQGDSWFDVYACYRDGLGWFVKIGETDDGLLVISHHAPEAPVTTVAGSIIHDIEPPKNNRSKE